MKPNKACPVSFMNEKGRARVIRVIETDRNTRKERRTETVRETDRFTLYRLTVGQMETNEEAEKHIKTLDKYTKRL